MTEKLTAVARTPNSRMREVWHPVVSLMKCAQWTTSVSRGECYENVSQIAVRFGRAGLGADFGDVPDGRRDRHLDLCNVIGTRRFT